MNQDGRGVFCRNVLYSHEWIESLGLFNRVPAGHRLRPCPGLTAIFIEHATIPLAVARIGNCGPADLAKCLFTRHFSMVMPGMGTRRAIPIANQVTITKQ